jgi:large subunit ribosomal protein L24
MKIKKGDKVKILIGKDKGRAGEVVLSFPKKRTVLISGLNLFKKHIKSTPQTKGGIVEKERPLGVSKVMLICPSCKKTIRVKYQIDKSGSKYRICPKCKSLLDQKIIKK